MKKTLSIFIVILLFLFAGIAGAQTWYPANEKTVAWDAVTTLESGDTIPADNVVRYEIYIKNADGTNIVAVSSTIQTSCTIPFSDEGKFFWGVKAIREVNGENVSESVINWSDNPDVCFNNEAHGIINYSKPGAPNGLRVQ
jgi:hypothetical protein